MSTQDKVWKTKSGEIIKISDMEDSHLSNTLKLLIRNYGKILISYDTVPKSITQYKTTIFLNLLEEYKKRDINIALLEVYHKNYINQFGIISKENNVLNGQDDFDDDILNEIKDNIFIDDDDYELGVDLSSGKDKSAFQVVGFNKVKSAYAVGVNGEPWSWGFSTNQKLESQPPQPPPSPPPSKPKPQIHIPGKRKINLE